MRLAWLIHPGIEEVPARMGPATHRYNPAGRFGNHRFVRRIGIRLQITSKLLEKFSRPVPASRIAVVKVRIATIAGAQVRPKVARPCRVPRAIKYTYWGIRGV